MQAEKERAERGREEERAGEREAARKRERKAKRTKGKSKSGAYVRAKEVKWQEQHSRTKNKENLALGLQGSGSVRLPNRQKTNIKLKNYIVRWHILNTKSLQHVETREELTTRL